MKKRMALSNRIRIPTTSRGYIYALFSLCFLTACATADPFDPVSASHLYQCDNGVQMVLALGDRAEKAALNVNGRSIQLNKIRSDKSELVYANEIYTLYHNDERGRDAKAVLEREGVPYLTGCHVK